MYKNKTEVAGFLGNPPIYRTVKNNMHLATFTVGVVTRKGIPPNVTKETEWIKVVVFGNDALAITSQLTKGDNVWVEGKCSVNSYTNKNGENINELSLMANKVCKITEIRYVAPAQGAPVAQQAQPQAPVAQPVQPVTPIAQPTYPQPTQPVEPVFVPPTANFGPDDDDIDLPF